MHNYPKTPEMTKLYFLLLAILLACNSSAQWFPQNSGTTKTLRSVYFTEANTGYAVGESGTIIKTVDTGTTWDSLSSGTTSNLNSVHFPTIDTGYVVGNEYFGSVLRTSDAGTTWTTILGSLYYLFSVFFTDANTGYISESDLDFGSGIIKTTDGGITWDYKSVDPQFCLFFPDPVIGYSVGVNDQIWSYGTINKTTDGGSTWIRIFILPGIKLNSVFFIDPYLGYTVGDDGVILKTTDGGIIWINQISETNKNLTSVCFTDADIGYAAGDSGIILKTINGGITWEIQPSGNTINLKSIFFIGADTGFVVGDLGTILKTTNGGGPPVGVNEKPTSLHSLRIYPNPASDKIIIETPTNGQLSIINLNGQQFITCQITELKTKLDISNLNTGLYIVKVIDKLGVRVGKIIKE